MSREEELTTGALKRVIDKSYCALHSLPMRPDLPTFLLHHLHHPLHLLACAGRQSIYLLLHVPRSVRIQRLRKFVQQQQQHPLLTCFALHYGLLHLYLIISFDHHQPQPTTNPINPIPNGGHIPRRHTACQIFFQ